MSISIHSCPHCQKEIRINDSVIEFSKFNIIHETCYRELQESNYQGAWLDEVEKLRKVYNLLIETRYVIESKNFGLYDFTVFQRCFYKIIDRLNPITDKCKGLNSFQKNKIKKTLKKSADKTGKFLTIFYNNKDALDNLGNILVKLLDNLMDAHDELKSCEYKTKAKIREEIQKRIDDIPKRVKRY